MAQPSVEPTSICHKAEPGETHNPVVSIAKAPSAAEVTASIIPENALMKIKQLVAFRTVRRPFTEEEINELPPSPPSIREKARRNGTVEIQEAGRSDGRTPLTVSTGFQVQIQMDFAAPLQQAPEVTTAVLRIDGTTWERVEIPLVLLIGRGAFAPAVVPREIRLAAEPGQVVTESFAVRDVPGAAKVMAHVEGGGAIIQLKRLAILRPIEKAFTEDEIDELPPFPPSIRENAWKNGYIEYQEVRTGGSCAPLEISKGFAVSGEVEFSAPAEQAPDSVSATLAIEGTTWRRAEVPLYLVIGKIETLLSTDSVTLRQGESANLDLTISSIAGPSTDVDLALGMDGEQWKITPSRIHVSRGATVSVAATITVEPCAPVGTYPVGLEVLSFEGLQFRRIPFQLEVRNGDVIVEPQQTALAATQGDQITCVVRVTSRGYKRMNFSAVSLPDGVAMNARVVEIACASQTTFVNLDFVLDPNATPIVNRRTRIRWSAGDAEHEGTLELSLTVNLRPESRTFTGQITTPPGTALGGWASITIRNDGTYTFSGHMHDSGFDPYSFRIGVTVHAPGSSTLPGLKIAVSAHKSGHVAGTLGSGERDFDWNESDKNGLIREFWSDLKNGTASFTKSYEDTGVLGTLEDIVTAIGEFYALAFLLSPVAGVAAPAVAGVIVVGSELDILPGVTGSLLILANNPWLLFLGPGVIVPVVTVGAIITAVKKRALLPEEISLAETVFGDTLPVDRIRLTDLASPLKDDSGENRAITLPDLDGSILVGLGKRFENTLSDANRPTLIHELTHTWQIEHAPFPPSFYFKVVIDRDYDAPPDGREWSDYGPEQQAMVVQGWYTRHQLDLNSKDALNDPAFLYIQNHIRLGEP